MTMPYDQAKRIIHSPDGRSDEEVAAAWAVYAGKSEAAAEREAAQPLPNEPKVYRPYAGVAYWWDAPSRSWHLQRDGAEGEPEKFRYMKEAKARARAITEGAS